MDRQRVLRTLFIGNFFMALGFNIWRAVFNNFAVEQLAIQPAQMGLIQSVREIPGLLGFATSFLALAFSELSLASMSVVIMGIGLFLMSFSTGVTTLLAYTLIFSVGFHLFNPTSSAVALISSDEKETPRLLGRLGSVGAAAAVLATLFIFLAVRHLGFRMTLVVAGIVTALGGLACVSTGRHAQGHPTRQKVIVRSRYWLFYALTFLMGSRRHIFSTFAIFLLVHDFGISTEVTATLFLVTSLLGTYTAHQQGKLTASLGERTTLSFYFLAIAAICVGYAYVSSLPLLFLLFIADSILSGFGIGINSYFRKIAPPAEVTANMSMSQTINHVSALFVPAVGGIIWEHFGPQSTFLFGFAVALVCLILTQWMRVTGSAPSAVGASGGK